jgi:hypothetical protein|tara:strand:- start:11639 stop:11773 length:135 start_codon:yes stop_codon:yes gene_type:complete
MNAFIETLIIGAALVVALLYLFRKQLWKAANTKKNCGNGGCGCD